MGLVDAGNRPGGAAFYAKKEGAMVLIGMLLGIPAALVAGLIVLVCA